MLLAITIIILFFLFFALLIIQVKVQKTSSDHAYHTALIRAIKKNKHRFIIGFKQIIGESNFAYPQLVHWIFSFFPITVITKRYYILGIGINLISFSVHLLICKHYHDNLISGLSIYKYYIYCGILYILTPFNWTEWNAKNSGISIRGIGILLIYLYTMVISNYARHDNIISFMMIIGVSLLVLLSSQMALQFVLLSLPVYAFFLSSTVLLMVPLVSTGLFFAFFPKIAQSFFKGQFWHKYIYFKYMAKIFILKVRPSIWRDFVWDFWKNMKSSLIKGLLYIYYNPLISISLSIPLLPLLIFYIIYKRSGIMFNIGEFHIILPVVVSLIVFLFTSFRCTRFLGEPERYVEFSLPYIIISSVCLFTDVIESAFHILIGLSIILILLNFRISLMKLKSNKYNMLPDIRVINDLLHNETPTNIRLFSNNIIFLKNYLVFDDVNVLIPNLTSNYTGKYHFTQLFKQKYPLIDTSLLLNLIYDFNINWFIQDTEIDESIELQNNHIKLDELASYFKYKIYRVILKI